MAGSRPALPRAGMSVCATMDHYSIVDPTLVVPRSGAEVAPAVPQSVAPSVPSRPATMSVSAAIAAANALSGSTLATASKYDFRFPGEDGGQSLAEMAEHDLDAALQLLADRAQYITGASGAAIALRRGTNSDMLCRASAGSNAPELGSLLSAEFGLSGESVRTRLPLRCDDAERDSRVNREGCRQLGISSVVVMPILGNDEVLGVFELFSGKVSAFDDRDISALQRLGEMVETAVKLSQPAASLSAEVVAGATRDDAARESEETPVEVEIAAPDPRAEIASRTTSPMAPEVPAATAGAVPTPTKRPLLWSAALQASADARKPPEADRSHVPPVLRSLKKCHACGFPVTEGRLLCVECEEKKWRGQLRSSLSATSSQAPRAAKGTAGPRNPEPPAVSPVLAASSGGAAAAPAKAASLSPIPEGVMPAVAGPPEPSRAVQAPGGESASSTSSSSTTPFSLSAGIAPSESWLAANKYIVVAILAIGAVIAVISYLR